MKTVMLTLCALLIASCAHDRELAQGKTPVGRETAIYLAKAEIARRQIRLPRNCRIDVAKDVIVVEFKPEVLIYAVSFNDPARNKPVPLYEVHINRRNGKIQGFIDTHIFIPTGG